MRRLLILALAAVAALAAASPAHAWQLERAKLIAMKVWHNPCGGDVAIHLADSAAEGITVRVADSIADQYPNRYPDELRPAAWVRLSEVRQGKCTVYVDIKTTFTREDWRDNCATIIHEFGHIAGYRDPANVDDPYHSLNPRSVMFVWGPTYNDPRCFDRGRRYLGMRPAHFGWF